MTRYRERFAAIEDWTAGLLITSGILIIFYAVVIRYVFNMSTSWQDEVARILVIWGAFIGASSALRDNVHIHLDFFYNIFSKRFRRWIDLFAHLVTLLFFLFLAVSGSQVVYSQFIAHQVSTGGYPLWMIYSIIPLAGLLLSVRVIIRLFSLFQENAESSPANQP